ncbi:MAG TPA: hypothetical protein VLW45_02405 [Pelomicrobium sp.]|nr:hypothetical protein [Pelomicrobium sp.]
MSTVKRSTGWWYWVAMVVLLAGEAVGWAMGGLAATALGVVLVLHYRVREGALRAFPVQVRLGYLVLLALGLWPPLAFVHWIQLAGTLALVLAGYCPLARMLALAPWNRPQPLSLALLGRAFLSQPSAGTILESLYGDAGGR